MPLESEHALTRDRSVDGRTFYEDRLASIDRQLVELERASRLFSRWRGVTFFSAAFLGLAGRFGDTMPYACYAAASAVFVVFIGLIIRHEDVIAQQDNAGHRRAVNKNQLSRMRRHWSQVPLTRVDVPEQHQALAGDLDLFEHASIFHLLCNAHTPMGQRTLRDWLLEPADVDEIMARQQAVTRLAAQVEFREELAVRGRLIAASRVGPDALIAWVEGESWLGRRPFLKRTTRLLTLLNVVTPLLALLGIVSFPVAMAFLLATIVTNLVVNVIFTGAVHEIFNSVDSKHNDVRHYMHMMDLVADLPTECERIKRLQQRLGETPVEPQRRLRQLTRIMTFANLRRSGFFGIFHIVFQILFLIDYHILNWLEVWQSENRERVRGWFLSIGELESLASLATLAHDHPAWVFPHFHADEPLQASALGHPLLDDDQCVRNDVHIGPRGRFLLVTGSNMSGKSTLLRSVGTNVMLAQAGSCTCAEDFALPPMVVASSMRIKDSLEDGVSFFMAELQRLKQIVDISESYRSDRGPVFLFLMDEVLQGTNSVERHLAVTRVLDRLLQNRAMGAVSTHDVELAASPELTAHCETVHFRETIHDSGSDKRMTFDYKMRPGLATTTNALKLLEMIMETPAV